MESLDHIGQTLLNIGAKMSTNSTLQDAIRAVVLVLINRSDTAGNMEKLIEKKVAEGFGALSAKLEGAVEQAVTKAIEVKQVEGELAGITGTQTPGSSQLTSSDCQALSYAMALARSPPSTHTPNVAKTDSYVRGIFLDRAPGAPDNQIRQPTLPREQGFAVPGK
ncbi:hypothetical protein BC629DRAFT_555693 [Irpex lacteus]|nr:hypothetical protein BC629DRAFT_555693 [Irpex lacteus]